MASSCESEGYCLQSLQESYLYTCHKLKEEIDRKRMATFLPPTQPQANISQPSGIRVCTECRGYRCCCLQMALNLKSLKLSIFAKRKLRLAITFHHSAYVAFLPVVMKWHGQRQENRNMFVCSFTRMLLKKGSWFTSKVENYSTGIMFLTG